MQNHDAFLHEMQADEADILLRLYYRQGALGEISAGDDSVIKKLVEKQLISTMVERGQTIVSLTTTGLDACSSMMLHQVQDTTDAFRQHIQVLPQRVVTCLVNRVIWHPSVEMPLCSSSVNYRPVNENVLWYERVLLFSDQIKQALGGLYVILDSLKLASKADGQWWCPPEVETFLKNEYKDQLGLSWGEEDMLKYYYFFSSYAFQQKNMLDMSGLAPRYKALLSGEPLSAVSWSGATAMGLQSLTQQLELNQNRVHSMFNRMCNQGFVQERYYPLSAFSMNDDEDTVFFIKDIKGYMKFIDNQFLEPVVTALLE